jgi:hypothetical protein
MDKSLHTLALEYVAKRIQGKIFHGKGNHAFEVKEYGGRVPDVVTDIGLHEVEVFHISHKVSGYLSVSGTKTLWIIIDADPSAVFDEIKVIKTDKEGTFFAEDNRFILGIQPKLATTKTVLKEKEEELHKLRKLLHLDEKKIHKNKQRLSRLKQTRQKKLKQAHCIKCEDYQKGNCDKYGWVIPLNLAKRQRVCKS